MESPPIEQHHYGVRVRGAEANDGLPLKGRLTTSKGTTRGDGKGIWEVRNPIELGEGFRGRPEVVVRQEGLHVHRICIADPAASYLNRQT